MPKKLEMNDDTLLQVAFDFGWYDVPRRIKLKELAYHLGVGKSTVSRRLQIIEKNIVVYYMTRNERLSVPVIRRQ